MVAAAGKKAPQMGTRRTMASAERTNQGAVEALTDEEKSKFRIMEATAPSRGGRGKQEETIPFGKLPLSTVVVGSDGRKEIIGPSLFLTEEDNPEAAVATARKRHKGFRFHTRKVEEDLDGTLTKGIRVWKEAMTK